MNSLGRKGASTIFVLMLLTGMLILTTTVQRVSALGTIYIRSDGSVDPSSAPITRNGNIYTLTGNINGSGINVQRDNVIIEGAGYILQGDKTGNGAVFFNRNNVTIRNLKVVGFGYGIWFNHCSNSIVTGDNLTRNSYGIELSNSSAYNFISGNSMPFDAMGIQLNDAGLGNEISGNSITNNNSTGIQLYSSTGTGSKNTNVTGNIMNYNWRGISVYNAPNNIILGNQILNSQTDGIILTNSLKETIFGNSITSSQTHGIDLQTTSNSTFIENNIVNSKGYGIYAYSSSSNNVFYHNSFINNNGTLAQAKVDSTSHRNVWDNGYPSGGNYWRNFIPFDFRSGPGQNQPGSDGIADIPNVGSNYTDHYPLMKPYGGQHDIGFTSLTSAQHVVDQGYNLNLVLKILNYAIGTETRNVSFYANNTLIKTAAGNNFVTVVLPARNTTALNFNWNTTGWAVGSYTVSATTPAALGETDISDNTIGNLHISITSVVSVSILPIYAILDVEQSQIFTASVQGGAPPYTYQWYLNGAGVPVANSQTWNFTPNVEGSYNIFVSTNDSIGFTTNSNIANVNVSPILSVSISPASGVMDVGQSRLFTLSVSGGTGPYFYQWYVDGNPEQNATSNTWSFTPATAYTYGVWVIVTDSATTPTSAKSNIATVIANSAPSVIISPSPFTTDVGQTQVLTSNAAGGTVPYTYQWYSNGTLVSGATDSTWTFIPSLAGSYNIYVTVTDDVGFTVASNIALVTVNPLPSVSVNPVSIIMGVGQSQTFISNVSGGSSPYSYQWYLDGVAVSGQTSSSWVFTPTAPGLHVVYVRIMDNVGVQALSNNATVMVNIHDIAVTNVEPFKTVIGQGLSINLNVTIADLGNYTETFTVTLYINTASVESQNVTLSSGNSTVLTLIWNTTGFAHGNYTISAYASPVNGESNTTNNRFTYSPVTVTFLGDVNGDGKVNVLDLIMIATRLGQSHGGGYTPFSKQWYNWSNCDINNDNTINVLDLIACATHLGQH
jgi:parallel beta-helix repeat protein